MVKNTDSSDSGFTMHRQRMRAQAFVPTLEAVLTFSMRTSSEFLIRAVRGSLGRD